jgi:spore protease
VGNLLPEFWRDFGLNLDLALEAHEVIRGDTGQEIPGVEVKKEGYEHTEVTVVKILDKTAEVIMGKPCGVYITLEAPLIKENNPSVHTNVSEILAKQLKQFINIPEYGNILLIGLGNRYATPDALGSKVIESSLVTRHLFNYAPGEVKKGMHSVSALAPGVLGITGIETAEIIKGVVEKTNPQMVIVIDSLAARSVARIVSTIQIADTGINPGSGVGNQRVGLNQETLGVPVIAIGVPTVVHAAVICQDTIEALLSHLKNKDNLYQLSPNLQPNLSREVIMNVLAPFGGNLTVTPKEIDALINRTARIIAQGISLALHPGLQPEDYSYYLH